MWLIAIGLIACGGQQTGSPEAGSGTDSGPDVVDVDVSTPQGLATFAFVVNGTTLTPMTCMGDDWEFPWPVGEGSVSPFPPAPGITSAVIVNTGNVAMAYVAQSGWNVGTHYVPGVAMGTSSLAGVLQPGAQVDITSVYVSGTVALVGSALPFSEPDASYAGDEGTIPWPSGVTGSDGATTMYIAELEVPSSPPSTCVAAFQAW